MKVAEIIWRSKILEKVKHKKELTKVGFSDVSDRAETKMKIEHKRTI